MSERRDSDRRDEDQGRENNADVEAGDVNNGGPVDSRSNEERPQDEEFGAIATTEPTSSVHKTDDDTAGYYGPRHKRLLTHICLLMWFCVFVLPRWAEYKKAPNTEWVASFKLEVGGAIIILLSLVVLFVMVLFETRDLCNSRILKLIPSAALMFGGFLYWVGGIQFAKSVNDNGKNQGGTHQYHLQGWAGAVFIESTFAALLSIVLGADYLTNFLSKSERIRVYLVHNTILAFCAIVGAFSYAAWRGYTTNYPIKVTFEKTSCVAAGWFFVFFACVYFYVVEFVEICCKCSASAQRVARERASSVRMAGIVILLFGGFLIMAGMWAIGSVGDKKWNCYYAGYGFFVLFFCCIFSLDLHLGRMMRK